MEIWDEIGEKLVELFNGDVICTDKDGVPKFSTTSLSGDFLQAVSVALKTGVRVGIVHDQKNTLVIPFDFTPLKGAVILIGYEFSEETLTLFVKNTIKDFAKAYEECDEETTPIEIKESFKGVEKPILVAATSEKLPDIQLRSEMAKQGGRFLKRMESGENFFIFDGTISQMPTDCKIGVSEDVRPEIAFHQAMTALHYGSDPSGISDYEKLSPSFLVDDIIKNDEMKKAVIDKLKPHPELLQTLRIFFDNDASPVKTSKVMKIHRNTILNRLNKVRDITYLDPKVFKDGVILYLILINSEGKSIE